MDTKQALLIEAIQYVTVNCYDKLIKKFEDSRNVLETCRAWAQEFEDWWNTLDDEEQERRDYLISIDAFCDRHLRAELTPDEPDEYIVRVTRIEKYEAAVRVTATSQYEAEQKVQHALEEEEYYSYVIEDMTECINVESQDYTARPMMPGDRYNFQIYKQS